MQRPKFNSVVEALEHWSKEHPDQTYCTIETLEGKEDITFKDLYEDSAKQAAHLQKLGLKRGDRVIVAVPNGKSFLSSFLGTLMAGGVAVPVVTREGVFQGLTRATEVFGHIFRDAAVKYVLTTQKNQEIWEKTLGKTNDPATISLVDKLPKPVQLAFNPLQVFPEDMAFIQYTSGSTSLPKGVVIRHHQLIAQLESIAHGLKSNVKDCAVSWLPLFHDMGLIGAFLHSLFVGMRLILMSPERFIFDPKQWLMAISRHRATMSAGPNSAYNLCAKKIRPEDLKDIDLSSWRVAFTGAEPISVDTMQSFIEKFRAYGFDPRAIVPGYGMAENCLAISFVQAGDGFRFDSILREDFEKFKKATPAQNLAHKETLSFVSCGKPVLGHEVAIVNDQFHIMTERNVGEIVVRGPSVMDGYFEKDTETKATIQNGWLCTGDLGYLADGNIYIVGRKKEMIIKGGRNYCPYDIEKAVSGIEGIRTGCVVALGVYDERTGTEKMIVIAEAKPNFYRQYRELSSKMTKAVFEAVGIAPDDVIVVPAGTLTKTTSGKIQRVKYQRLYLDGKLKNGIGFFDRLRYFKFRVFMLIAMFFYFVSSLLKKGFHHDERSNDSPSIDTDHKNAAQK